jgi:hypothetical protein
MLGTKANMVPDAANQQETVLTQNPSFLLVGFRGSGIALLQRMLDAHPDITVTPAINWIFDYFETRTGLDADGRVAWGLIEKWIDQKRFDAFSIDREALSRLIGPCERLPYQSFVARLLDQYGKVKGKRLVGSETPQECMPILPALHGFWPRAKFIHLIRDGRDVCLSLLKESDSEYAKSRFATWTEDPIATLALWWRRKVRQAREGGQALGEDLYSEVRYEALLADPAAECARLCAFLGVPYDDAMVRRPESTQSNWRSQMATEEVERFEAVARKTLKQLGYPRAIASLRPELARRAARLREAFKQPARPAESSAPALAHPRPHGGRTNPFVFIVGCPRSGTTLLQRIVDAHPEMAIHETFWIPYYFEKRIGLTPDGRVTPELVSRLFEYYRFYRMKLARAEVERLLVSGDHDDYATFVTALFDLYGKHRGKALVGDKTPEYVHSISTLHALWPKAKFVHLIRDGRDVCLSAVHWRRKTAKLAALFTTWREDPITTGACWWDWHVRRGLEAGKLLGPELYCEVRYEALIARPEEECARLCNFLDVPFAEVMLRFYEGRTRDRLDLDAKDAWLPITAGLRDWRSQMAADEVERFEAAAGDLLEQLGCARDVPRPRLELLRHAARIRQAFFRDARALDDRLP